MKKKNVFSLKKLVDSTNRTERAYIKKYLNRFSSKESSFTAQLFDLYCKNEEVNDEKFRIKLKATSPIYANYKFQLYKLILQALAEISKGESIQNQLLGWLEQIEVLYKKSLFRDALLLIRKAKELANKHQEFRLLPQIIQWQILVMQYITSTETDFTNEKDKLLDESIHYLEIQKNITKYQQLKKDFQAIRSTYKDDQEGLRRETVALLKNPIMQNDDQPLSSLAKLHYHQLHYLINLRNDLNQALEHSNKMLYVLENELGEDYINHNLTPYVDAHFNILSAASEMKNKQGFFDALAKIESLEVNYNKKLKEDANVHIFWSKYLLLSEHFYSFDATDKLIQSVPDINKGMEKYHNKIRTLITTHIFFGIGNAFFVKKEYNKAISWYSKVINYPKEQMFQATYIKSHVMNVICHYETNYLHLAHILENAKSALRGLIPENSFEADTFKFIQGLGKGNKPQNGEWPYLLW